LKLGWNAGALCARRRAVGAARRAHTARRLYVVTEWTTRRSSWPSPRPRALAPARARCRRPGHAVRTPSRWPRAAPNASGPSRPSHLACMRAIRPGRRPMHSSRLAFARAQLRAAPPRLPSPPVGAHWCAPLSTTPARVQASQWPPTAALVPSCACVLVGRVTCEDHVWFEDRWMVASLCDE
jgi:hypothetical protein